MTPPLLVLACCLAHLLNTPLGFSFIYSKPTAMPYQLRNRTRVADTEPKLSSAAPSVTLEHNENEADEPPLNRRSGTRRLMRDAAARDFFLSLTNLDETDPNRFHPGAIDSRKLLTLVRSGGPDYRMEASYGFLIVQGWKRLLVVIDADQSLLSWSYFLPCKATDSLLFMTPLSPSSIVLLALDLRFSTSCGNIFFGSGWALDQYQHRSYMLSK